ncbi:hypothetical protein BTO00_22640, partial [Vibrio campbellii]
MVAFDTFTRLQSRIDSSNAILAWSTETSGTAPTLEHYANTVIDGVSADNLSDVNTQLQSRNLTDMSDVQPFVDAVNKVLAYTANAEEARPEVDVYSVAGVMGVNDDNIDLLSSYIGSSGYSVVQVQALVAKIDSLLVLRKYSEDEQSNRRPELDDYTGAEISEAREDNLEDYNNELITQTLTTEDEFRALVDAINALDDYASEQTVIEPSLDTYKTAGVDFGEYANRQPHETLNRLIVQSNAMSLEEVRALFQKLVSYYAAQDNGDTTFSYQDYTTIGVDIGDESLVDYINKYTINSQKPGFTHYVPVPDGIVLNSCKSSEVGITACVGTSPGASYLDKLVIVTTRNKHVDTKVWTIPEDGCAVARFGDWDMLGDGTGIYVAKDLVPHSNAYTSNQDPDCPTMRTGYTYRARVIDGKPYWGANSGVVAAPSVNFRRFTYPGYIWTGSSWSRTTYYTGAKEVETGRSIVMVGTTSYARAYSDMASASDLWSNVGAYIVMGEGLDEFSSGRQESNYRKAHKISVSYEGSHYLERTNSNNQITLKSTETNRSGYFTNSSDNDDLILSPTGRYLYRKTTSGDVTAYEVEGSYPSSSAPASLGSSYAPNVGTIPQSLDGEAFSFTGHWSENQIVVSNANGFSVVDVSSNEGATWSISPDIVQKPSFAGNLSLAAAGYNRTVAFAASDDVDFDGYVYNVNMDSNFDASDYSSSDQPFDSNITTSTSSAKLLIAKDASTSEESITLVQRAANSANTILEWASGSVVEPTLGDYTDAYIANVSPSNLDDVNKQLQILAHDDIEDVQPMVDAINVLLDYSNSEVSSREPTVDDYLLAGVPMWMPLDDMNSLILDQNYSIQDILDLFPLAIPLLDAESPLNSADTIAWLNEELARALFSNYAASQVDTPEMSFVWQVKEQGSSSWQNLASSAQPIDSVSEVNLLPPLTVGARYRLELIVESNTFSFPLHSSPTSEVIDTSDIDLLFGVVTAPREGVPYSIDSALDPASQLYSQKITEWFRYLANGTLQPIQQSDSYTPSDIDVDHSLVAKVTYKDSDQNVIVSRYVITPTVLPRLTSEALQDLASVLSLALTPDGVSVGTQVRLVPEDQRAIDDAVQNNNIAVTYHWEKGGFSTWEDASGSRDGESYIALAGDVGQSLRVVLTLTDNTTSESLELTSQPSGVVQANDTGLETFTLFLEFDGSLLSLTSASAERLTTFMSDENLVNPTYAWLRIPASGGSFEVGAEEVGTDAGGYLFDTTDDLGFSHGLRVTLQDGTGQTVTLFSDITPAWDGNTDPDDGSDLAIELERLRYMDVLTLQGGSDPALAGDVLQAVLAGSVSERDLTP